MPAGLITLASLPPQPPLWRCERLVVEGLPDLELVSTLGAAVAVGGHGGPLRIRTRGKDEALSTRTCRLLSVTHRASAPSTGRVARAECRARGRRPTAMLATGAGARCRSPLAGENGAAMVAVLCLVPWPTSSARSRAPRSSPGPGASTSSRRARATRARRTSTRLLGWKAGAGRAARRHRQGRDRGRRRASRSTATAAPTSSVSPRCSATCSRSPGGSRVGAASRPAGGVLVVAVPARRRWCSRVVWFVIARGLHKASIASLVCAVLFPIDRRDRAAARWVDIAVVVRARGCS